MSRALGVLRSLVIFWFMRLRVRLLLHESSFVSMFVVLSESSIPWVRISPKLAYL